MVKNPYLKSSDVGLPRKRLVFNSAHVLSPALGAFSGLCTDPFYVYNIFSFDKLYVFNLGIIRQFCDPTNVVVRCRCNLPFSRVMAIVNNRFNDMLPSVHLPIH